MRLRSVYYVLAIFDLLTVSVGLIVIDRITGIYTHSVEENLVWAQRLGDYSDLSQLAAAVNAPGNDVFQTQDVARERARLQAALDEFNDRADAVRADLMSDVEPERAGALLESFTAMNGAMENMVEKSKGIFASLEAGETARAGEQMAEMDRAYGAVNLTLSALGAEARTIQREIFERQAAKAASVRKLEWLIAGLMILMICGVTYYGNRLAVQVRRDAIQTQQLIEERTRELEESHQRLRIAERLASIGTLAAGLGHDMKNVLFPVMCRLDVLEEQQTTTTGQDEVAQVRDSVRYLQQLSEGLRLLALDPEDARATSATTELAEWMRNVEPLLRTCLPRHATFACEAADQIQRASIATHQLTQAVFNLVHNAGEAISARGNVRLHAAVIDKTTIRIAVTDDGHGMTPEVRRQALDPFFSTKRRSLSTGLGLALVHGIAQGVGGRVEIESEPGHGTTVSLILPTAPRDRPSATPRHRIIATVSLSDRRIATFLVHLLRASGADAHLVSRYDALRVVSSPGGLASGEPSGSSGDSETSVTTGAPLRDRHGTGSRPYRGTDGSHLWICEAGQATPAEVRAFLEDKDGASAIVIGATTNEWAETGAHLIETMRNAAEIRAAIRQVLPAAEEKHA